MELIRKNKYVHVAFRFFVALVIAELFFLTVSSIMIIKGAELSFSSLGEIERFSALIGIIMGYFAASVPKIMEPIFSDE